MKDENEQFLREKYMEMQFLDENMKKVQQQLENIDEQTAEVLRIKQYLDDFASIKKDTETLVPITNGIFAKAEIKDNKKLLVNVGNNVVTEKTVDETKKLMDDQLTELKKYHIQLTIQLQTMTAQIKEIEKTVEEKVNV